jgi:hypothetical protein
MGINEPRRQHADDRAGPAVEVNLAAHDCGIAGEAPLKHAPHKHDDGAARPVLGFIECAAQCRLYAKQLKQVP